MKIILYLLTLIGSLFFADGGFELSSSSMDLGSGISSLLDNSNKDNDSTNNKESINAKNNTRYSLDDFKEIHLDKPN